MSEKVKFATPRDEAKRLAFRLINAKAVDVEALIDAIIEAAKEEMRDELNSREDYEV